MKRPPRLINRITACVLASAAGLPAFAAGALQVGSSGKTQASTAVQCAVHPVSGQSRPLVQAGLYNPKPGTTGAVSLNGALVLNVTASVPMADVWLADGDNSVTVTLGKKAADRYAFSAPAGLCSLPDTSANTFSADGTLEYAASGKSYATVTPGCALNGATGLAQPYVHLFDNGGYLLNVSVNGVPLTQLSAQRPHVPVFLRAGQNVISAANGSLSTDYFVRNGGTGSCTLP